MHEPGTELGPLPDASAPILAEGSLSGAARALGLTQPTVARHVDQLEAALGRRLFVRTPRGLSPTEAALEVAPYAEAMAAAGAALRRAATAGREAVEGTVRVTASEVFGVERLPPILAGLRARHPRLALELVASNAAAGPAARATPTSRCGYFDPVQEALVARRVGAVELGLFATPGYLARRGAPDALADAAALRPDRLRPRDAGAAGGAGRDLRCSRREGFAFRADSDLAQMAALRAGVRHRRLPGRPRGAASSGCCPRPSRSRCRSGW